MIFRDRAVPVEIVWEKMVLISKGKGEYRYIGLVELLWKVCSVVTCFWLKRSVLLHNTLRGLIEGRGTGTETLEVNLSQQLAGLAHKPLFQFLLAVWKAYESLGWEQCLELLRGYGLGPNLARILDNYCCR